MQTLLQHTKTNEYGNQITVRLVEKPAGHYPAGSGSRFEPFTHWHVQILRGNDPCTYGQIFKDKLDALHFFNKQIGNVA